MRGTQVWILCAEVYAGIIPAYAGNTMEVVPGRFACWDHHRVCGEHFGSRRVACVVAGSSPRMRGTRVFRVVSWSLVGIIPAYAGNTVWMKLVPDFRRDHPRVCGEHMPQWSRFTVWPGSSPRMRGTHLIDLQLDDRAGIIPAYAGNTLASSPLTGLFWDHPRVCGEHNTGAALTYLLAGSSPRMRGTHVTPNI